MRIEDWRAEIDKTDKQLVRLLNRRARLAVEVGRLKREVGLPICDRNRERAVLVRACRTNGGPLDHEALIKIFRGIIRESRRAALRAVKACRTPSRAVWR